MSQNEPEPFFEALGAFAAYNDPMTNLEPAIDMNAVSTVVREVMGALPAAADLAIHARGDRTIVDVGSEVVAIVAHTSAADESLAAERRCFEKLAGRVTLRVPRTLGTRVVDGYTIEVRTRVSGLPSVSATTPAQSQRFGMAIGRAFASLHDAFTSGELRDLALPAAAEIATTEAMARAIDAHLEGPGKVRALRFVERWEKRPRGGDCFSVGGLDESSLVCDHKSRLPIGMNHLRAAGLRRPAFDLASLCSHGEHVLRAAEEAYATHSVTKVRVAHEEVRAVHAALAVSALAMASDAPMASVIARAIRAVAESSVA